MNKTRTAGTGTQAIQCSGQSGACIKKGPFATMVPLYVV